MSAAETASIRWWHVRGGQDQGSQDMAAMRSAAAATICASPSVVFKPARPADVSQCASASSSLSEI